MADEDCLERKLEKGRAGFSVKRDQKGRMGKQPPPPQWGEKGCRLRPVGVMEVRLLGGLLERKLSPPLSSLPYTLLLFGAL